MIGRACRTSHTSTAIFAAQNFNFHKIPERHRSWVDGAERTNWRVDGVFGWAAVRSVAFTTDGTHTVRWVYHKDESESDGEDCAWVGGVTWMPAGGNPAYRFFKVEVVLP